MFEIKTFKTEELINNSDFLALCLEYAKCNAIPNTDAVHNFQLADYLPWGENVAFAVLFEAQKMVGLAVVLKQYHMHTNEFFAVLDGYFVLPEYRGKGRAEALLEWAKNWAKSIEAPILMLTAPAGSRLEKFYTRKFKRLESWYAVEIEK